MEKQENSSLEDLESRIKSAKTAHLPGSSADTEKKPQGAASLAFKVGTELMAGVAVGLGVGYYLDKWLETSPVFFLICFCLGAGAGGLNIYRMSKPEQGEDNQ